MHPARPAGSRRAALARSSRCRARSHKRNPRHHGGHRLDAQQPIDCRRPGDRVTAKVPLPNTDLGGLLSQLQSRFAGAQGLFGEFPFGDVHDDAEVREPAGRTYPSKLEPGAGPNGSRRPANDTGTRFRRNVPPGPTRLVLTTEALLFTRIVAVANVLRRGLDTWREAKQTIEFGRARNAVRSDVVVPNRHVARPIC